MRGETLIWKYLLHMKSTIIMMTEETGDAKNAIKKEHQKL